MPNLSWNRVSTPNRGITATKRGNFLAFSIATLIGAGLGYLGFILPVPGGSVVAPSLIVLGIGAAVAVGPFALWALLPGRQALMTFVLAEMFLALLASIWVLFLSLPVSMALVQGSADKAAESYLFSLNHGDLSMTVPTTPCKVVTSGSIGLIDAPYKECATSTAEGHFVRFQSMLPGSVANLTYTDIGSETFLETCFRHLAGHWYTSTRGNLSNLGNPCPLGYEFQGGP